jgi:hypothetical protein
MTGRLIRIDSGDHVTMYAVAESDGRRAESIIRDKVAKDYEMLNDMGPISDRTIEALNLQRGGYVKL